MNDIEQQLLILKPVGQPDLARKILAIPHRKRQRRRDCFFAFGGLLTGIAATVLVMVATQTAAEYLAGTTDVLEVAVNQNPHAIDRHSREGGNLDVNVNINPLAPRLRGGDDIRWGDVVADPIDLDAWIARYDKLFRHRREAASVSITVKPIAVPMLPDGMSPLEYRGKLLAELGG